MNENKFESGLRKAMSPDRERMRLSAKIDDRIARSERSSRRGRGWKGGLAAAAAVGFVFMALPVARAQAFLATVSGKLDNVKEVSIRQFAIAADGTRIPQGSTDYQDGKWRLDQGNGNVTVYLSGRNYRYDPKLAVYIVDDRPQGPFEHNPSSMKLSSLLRDVQGSSRMLMVGVVDKVVANVPVSVATLDNTPIGERLVITADRRTQLPTEAAVYVRSGESWRLAMVMEFDYSPAFENGHFALKDGVQQVSRSEAERRLVESVTTEEVASIPLRKGRLVVRSFDVARDGTVFVAYQAGDSSHSWNGNRFQVTDSLGTRYCDSPPMFCDEPDFAEKSTEGMMRLEVFVPLHPLSTWKPRTVDISVCLTKERETLLFMGGFVGKPDGSYDYDVHPNAIGTGFPISSQEDLDAAAKRPFVSVFKKTFGQPTCEDRAHTFELLDRSHFGTDDAARIFKADTLAQAFQRMKDFPEAERWTLETIRLKRELEHHGGGAQGTRFDEERLDQVRRRVSFVPQGRLIGKSTIK